MKRINRRLLKGELENREMHLSYLDEANKSLWEKLKRAKTDEEKYAIKCIISRQEEIRERVIKECSEIKNSLDLLKKNRKRKEEKRKSLEY